MKELGKETIKLAALVGKAGIMAGLGLLAMNASKDAAKELIDVTSQDVRKIKNKVGDKLAGGEA